MIQNRDDEVLVAYRQAVRDVIQEIDMAKTGTQFATMVRNSLQRSLDMAEVYWVKLEHAATCEDPGRQDFLYADLREWVRRQDDPTLYRLVGLEHPAITERN